MDHRPDRLYMRLKSLDYTTMLSELTQWIYLVSGVIPSRVLICMAWHDDGTSRNSGITFIEVNIKKPYINLFKNHSKTHSFLLKNPSLFKATPIT